MKILFSLTFFTPYNSGLTNYVKILADELARDRKYKVSVLCMRHEKILAERETTGEVEIIRANPTFSLSKGFISLEWLVKSVTETRKNDVVIVNLPQAEGIFTAIAAKILHKKLVSIYHAKVLLRGGFTDKIIERVLENINTLIMLLSDKVVTYTDVYAENMEAYPKIRNKLSAVYPPIRLPFTDRKTTQEIKSKIPKRATAIIGMAARLAEDKGFEYMIEALGLLEKHYGPGKAVVVVAGPMKPVGETAYRSKILRLLETKGKNFIFLGEIDNNKIGSFYKLIDVLAVPSILESFGIVQAEAMMMGVPVVTSNLPGANVPINRTGMGILVPSKNPAELALAVIKAIKNRAVYSQLKEKAIKEFSLSNNLNFFKNLFKEYESGFFEK